MSEGNREMLLKTRGLTKQFGKHVAVDHVDMHIRRGAIYGFIGRNGAGKTTVLKMIAGLADPTAGEYEIFGCSGKSLAKVRSRVGCLIEQPGMYPNMSAQDNLMIKAELFGIRDKKYAEELLELVGLVHAGRKKTKHFSLGMKQRLGIALALVGNPDFLVLDEPINGLDPQGIVEIRDMLQRLSEEQNITILKQEIADITGIKPSNIARFESGGRVPTLVVLEKYANALGKHIEIKICDD